MEKTKNLIYALTCLSFSIIIGAAVYEHIAVWPRAHSSLPASLTMFQGDFGLNPGAFWIKIHPATLFLFILSLILFWKSNRRKNILIALIGYFMMIIATGLYFVPELIDIAKNYSSTDVDVNLQKRGDLWEKLSLIRLGFLIVLSLILFFGLAKNSVDNSNNH